MRGPTESESTTPGGPAGAASSDPAAAAQSARYAAIHASPEFAELRARYRRFVIPTTLAALAFYFTYAILAAYAPDFMGSSISGNVNVGLVFGLLQFVMVFGVTTAYVRYARTSLDPAAEAIRARFDDAEDQGAAR